MRLRSSDERGNPLPLTALSFMSRRPSRPSDRMTRHPLPVSCTDRACRAVSGCIARCVARACYAQL
eukprot:3208231-Prymnesium_polylepis.1